MLPMDGRAGRNCPRELQAPLPIVRADTPHKTTNAPPSSLPSITPVASELRRIAAKAEGFAAGFRFGKHRAGAAADEFKDLAADIRALVASMTDTDA